MIAFAPVRLCSVPAAAVWTRPARLTLRVLPGGGALPPLPADRAAWLQAGLAAAVAKVPDGVSAGVPVTHGGLVAVPAGAVAPTAPVVWLRALAPDLAPAADEQAGGPFVLLLRPEELGAAAITWADAVTVDSTDGEAAPAPSLLPTPPRPCQCHSAWQRVGGLGPQIATLEVPTDCDHFPVAASTHS